MNVEEKAIVADAGLLRELVAAARKQLAAAPDKLDYGQRLAVALLALDAKQDDLAGEFFELAIKVRPQRAAAVLAVWGLGLLDEGRSAEAAKAFQRGIDSKRLRKTAPLSTSTFPPRWRRRGGSTRPWRPPARPRSWAKTCPSFAFVRRGFSARPSDTTRRSPPSPPCWRGLTPTSDDQTRKLRREAQSAIAKGDFQPRPTSACSSRARTSGSPRKRATSLHDARLALADLCILSNRIAEGEEWVEQVLDEYPEDAAALNELGYLWADQGVHLDRALEMIRKAVAAEPDNAAYRDSLGWVLYRLGRGEEAVAELQKAAAGKEPDGEILDHLGEALAKIGRRTRREAAWRRAAAAFRKAKEEKKAKQVEKKIHKKST